MAWAIDFDQDTEIPGVGTATATYTDEQGKVSVAYSQRIDNRDGSTIDQFIGSALARWEKRKIVDTDTAALLAKIQAVLTEKTK
jgi:hypothetical protein